jgi:hypothetical protein
MQASENPDPALLQKQVLQTACDLVKDHGFLLEHNLNERSITHKFAELLQRVFPEWDVDCEYNRNHDKMKTLNLPPRKDITSGCSGSAENGEGVFPVRYKERTHEEATEALLAGRESRHPEAAFAGQGADLEALR